MNEQADAVRAFLVNVGAENVRMGHGRKHPRVLFDWRGEPRFYVVPGTPGDSRSGSLNSITDIRHMLGLVEPVKRVGRRRTHRKRAAAPKAACPTLTGAPDWTVALYGALSPAELRKRLDAAFLALWRDCMRSAGGESRLIP